MGISAIVAGATAAIGIGTSLKGMAQQQKGYDQMQRGYAIQQQAAEQAAQLNKNIVGDELKQEAVRRQAMELDARRNTLQMIRQSQQSRSMSIAAATAQGAGFAGGAMASTGLLGSLAQIQGHQNFNINGIQQNLQMGRSIFDINADISQQKIGLADTQTTMAQGQGQVAMGQGLVGQGSGYMSLGGQLVSSAGTFGNIAGNFGSFGNQINQGVQGGGYFGTGGQLYPGPGRY